MVIQNATFDLDMLAKEGFELKMQLIDTFRVLRAKYPLDGTSHGLQYRRYQWGLYEKEQAIIDKLGVAIQAHDALGDVIVLKNLFDKLVGEISIEVMIELCSEPILLEYMPMGKFKGQKISEIALNERDTLHYMLSKMDLDEDIKYSFNHHLEATAASVVATFGFGKFKGLTPAEVLLEDKGYLLWVRDKAQNISTELKKAVEIALGKTQ
jgi:exodeoxyribonuclease X